jgi:hypothetical protein
MSPNFWNVLFSSVARKLVSDNPTVLVGHWVLQASSALLLRAHNIHTADVSLVDRRHNVHRRLGIVSMLVLRGLPVDNRATYDSPE